MKTVARHRRCQGCGYDLFSLPADGVCPECGRGIGGIRKQRKPKDPRRVAGQLRRMVAQGKRNEYVAVALWAVPLLGLSACWWFGAHWYVWVLASLAFMSGIIQHFAERSRREDYERRLSQMAPKEDAA